MAATAGIPPLVELRGVTKRFGDLTANDAVDLSVGHREIHALLGENGAGKTTLMRILYGLTVPDAGEIRIEGRSLRIGSPADAIAAGIGMVTQHFSLVRPMSVVENLVLGRAGRIRLDLPTAAQRIARDSERVGIAVDPAARVGDLSIGEQQRVEILKALSRECRVLVLDEPTAVLVPHEVTALFATLRRLVADGMSVIFISHKLREVIEITDRVTVLRRGRNVGSVATPEADEGSLARLMVGGTANLAEAAEALGIRSGAGRRAAPAADPPGTTGGASPVLEVRDLSVAGAGGLDALRAVRLDVQAGEILGVAGVSGNGQTELAEVLSGIRPPSAGSIRIGGHELAGRGVARFLAEGVGRIPEDRQASLVPNLSVAYNLVLEHLDEFTTGGRLDERWIRGHAEALIDQFDIRARPSDGLATLSGGNVQKVLLARVLSREPRVLIVAQPTRGLDVGATAYVRSQLVAARDREAAILLISEDLDELLELADRLVVLYEGRIVGTMRAAGADAERLGLLMAGRTALAA